MTRTGRRTRAVAGVIALAVAASGALAACGTGGGKAPLHFSAYFTRTISLYPQSDVRILGLHAGRVHHIEVVGTKVRVDFTVDAGNPVPADVHATIVPLSLIGERYLQLFPAWTGGPKLTDRSTIPLERTTVPVEPDEALASLKKLLENLNPDGAHRLVSNLADDLQGQGQALNDTLHSLGGLTQTLADKSDALGKIIDNFDAFTATLVTREKVLGQVMDDFASLTSVLADERSHVEGLLKNLATVAADARDLVAEHRAGLDRDLTTLGHVAKAIDANLDSVQKVLDAPPILATGLQQAYNPGYHGIDLRNSFSPDAEQALLNALGGILPDPLTTICLPIDVSCVPKPAASPANTRAAPAVVATTTTRPSTATPVTPSKPKPGTVLDGILNGLRGGSTRHSARTSSRRSSFAGNGVFHLLGRAAHSLSSTVREVLR